MVHPLAAWRTRCKYAAGIPIAQATLKLQVGDRVYNIARRLVWQNIARRLVAGGPKA